MTTTTTTRFVSGTSPGLLLSMTRKLYQQNKYTWILALHHLDGGLMSYWLKRQIHDGTKLFREQINRSKCTTGAVLWPMLFTIYTSDIPAREDHNNTTLRQFANVVNEKLLKWLVEVINWCTQLKKKFSPNEHVTIFDRPVP